jgi:predicted PurR-regulated permease PerM
MSELLTNNLLKWLLVILLLSTLLYFGALLFIPILFGLLIAFVMYPLCIWLEHHGTRKYLAITICMAIVLALFFGLIYLLGWQVQLFKQEIPEISQKLKIALLQLQKYLEHDLKFTTQMQDEWVHNFALNSGDKIMAIINQTFSATVDTLFMAFISPVYAILFLYHRSIFVKALILLLGIQNEEKIRKVLQQVVFTYANFVRGMIMVYLIVGILNTIGLSVLGIKHALLFGMLTAIMTIIPYVGIIFSALLPVCIAFITKDSIWYPVGVIAVFVFVQYLEGNIIFPKIVGQQLELSTWATLVAIIAGGIIWGVAGMILFIPLLAILKIVAQNISNWQPLYVLLNRNEL